jgi:hypothetical protein
VPPRTSRCGYLVEKDWGGCVAVLHNATCMSCHVMSCTGGHALHRYERKRKENEKQSAAERLDEHEISTGMCFSYGGFI